jgi:hypothetical protein
MLAFAKIASTVISPFEQYQYVASFSSATDPISKAAGGKFEKLKSTKKTRIAKRYSWIISHSRAPKQGTRRSSRLIGKGSIVV